MSLSQNPLTGKMRQSMANFVTTVYRGQNVIRAKVFMPRNANSIAQQLYRASFRLIVDAYVSFGGITNDGFPERQRIYTPYNAFMKANLSRAIDMTIGTPVIDYSKMLVSEGSLPELLAAGNVTEAGISVSYETSDTPKVLPSDQVIAFIKTVKGSLRVARQVRGNEPQSTLLIPYPGITAADVVCCFAFVLNAQGTKASNSAYVEVV